MHYTILYQTRHCSPTIPPLDHLSSPRASGVLEPGHLSHGRVYRTSALSAGGGRLRCYRLSNGYFFEIIEVQPTRCGLHTASQCLQNSRESSGLTVGAVTFVKTSRYSVLQLATHLSWSYDDSFAFSLTLTLTLTYEAPTRSIQ